MFATIWNWIKASWKVIVAVLVATTLCVLWFFGIIGGRDRMEAVETGVATNRTEISSVAQSLQATAASLAAVDGRVAAVEQDLQSRPTTSTVDATVASATAPLDTRIGAVEATTATNTTEIAALGSRLDVLEGSGDQGAVRLGAYNADRQALDTRLAEFVTSDQLQPIQAQLQEVTGVTEEQCLAALDVQSIAVGAATCGETQVSSPLPGCVCRVTPAGDASCEGSDGLRSDLETETRRRRYADRQLEEALEALQQAAAPAAQPATAATTPTAPPRGVVVVQPTDPR